MNLFFGKYELDVYWDEVGLAVELDTFETHGSRRAFEIDSERDAVLLEEGIRTIRVTDRQLETQPDEVLRRLSALLVQPPRLELGALGHPLGRVGEAVAEDLGDLLEERQRRRPAAARSGRSARRGRRGGRSCRARRGGRRARP